MNDNEIIDTTTAVKMVEKKGDMTPTAEKFYEIYDKARALFRAMKAAEKEEPKVQLIEDGSDTKTTD
jgi:hypothetical protein